MPEEFTRTALPGRVVFASGALARLGAELDVAATRRAMLVVAARDADLAEKARSSLGDRAVLTWTEVTQHVPAELALRATTAALDAGVDVLVTIGGGSTTGLGKAVAVQSKLPLVVVPTTYAGSEMTPIYGLTSDNEKKTARDANALPQLVIYDPQLLATLPPAVAGPSALNALAHCAEALWAAGRDPVNDAIALDGARRIHEYLPAACAGEDLGARGQVLLAASMAGTALASAGTSLHHSLCHLLGGMFDAQHAQTHAILLPYAIGFLRPSIDEPVKRLASCFGVPADQLEPAIWRLARSAGTPRGLREIGLNEQQIEQAALAAVSRQLPSPRHVTVRELRPWLMAAWTGEPPSREIGARSGAAV
ncbi:maleylacetate reductase [Streptomyces sulfonofaciens]|nr:maleylacetate reductase [Streptomyces sulfonofaciens]